MTEPPPFRFHHGGVSVPDLAAGIAWYKDMLGFEVESEFYLASIPAKVAMLKRGPMRMELFEPEDGAVMDPERSNPQADIRTYGNKHLAFAVDDIAALIDGLTARGVDVASVLRDASGVRGCFIRDMAGNPIEFLQYADGEATRVLP